MTLFNLFNKEKNIEVPQYIQEFGYKEDWLQDKELRKYCYKKAKQIYKQELKRLDWCNIDWYFGEEIFVRLSSEPTEKEMFPCFIAQEWLEQTKSKIEKEIGYDNKYTDTDEYRYDYKEKYLKKTTKERTGNYLFFLICLIGSLVVLQLYNNILLLLYLLIGFIIAHFISILENKSFSENISIFNNNKYKKILVKILVILLLIIPLLAAKHINIVTENLIIKKIEDKYYNNTKEDIVYEENPDLDYNIPGRFR